MWFPYVSDATSWILRRMLNVVVVEKMGPKVFLEVMTVKWRKEIGSALGKFPIILMHYIICFIRPKLNSNNYFWFLWFACLWLGMSYSYTKFCCLFYYFLRLQTKIGGFLYVDALMNLFPHLIVFVVSLFGLILDVLCKLFTHI